MKTWAAGRFLACLRMKMVLVDGYGGGEGRERAWHQAFSNGGTIAFEHMY